MDTSGKLFGRKLRLPVMLAPVARWKSFSRGGAAAAARRRAQFGIAHMLSSVCDPGAGEAAAAAADALRMFQLYVRGDAAWVDDYVGRAIANGYGVLPHGGHRVLQPARARHRQALRHRRAPSAAGREFQAALDGRTVKRFKDNATTSR